MFLKSDDLDHSTDLEEFDIWITPSLGEVQDTERFKEELEKIVTVFDIIGTATESFSSQDLDTKAIAHTFIELLSKEAYDDDDKKLDLLLSLASLMFLVTGKSDNSSKCLFPLFLRDVARWEAIPKVRGRKNIRLDYDDIPRVLTSTTLMKKVVRLGPYPEQQERVLREFINYVLDRESHVSQLWSVGRSYFMLKDLDKEKDLLTPLVVFQVRGSVAASGGHDPEHLLRDQMIEWGLRPSIDFNKADVLVEELSGRPDESSSKRTKDRKYDFVLPYRTPAWPDWPTRRLFVQCQFYAGDSGSVSHKNVDQTDASRAEVLQKTDDATFIEYVDGAGYFSSLNGDLNTLLAKATTHSFFQVRTAPIRLRRELQRLGFLMPLDLEHAVIRAEGRPDETVKILLDESYEQEEIERCMEESLERSLIIQAIDGSYTVAEDRLDTARRYLLLDLVANHGQNMNLGSRKLSGVLLVPGYGPFYGMPLDEIARLAVRDGGAVANDFAKSEMFTADISWLCERGYAMS